MKYVILKWTDILRTWTYGFEICISYKQFQNIRMPQTSHEFSSRLLSKENIAIKRSMIFKNFLVHIKIMFTLYCSLVSVQYIMSEKTIYMS